MLFFPFGVFNKDAVEPDKLANEFQEAHRVASNCTQYQFTQSLFDHSFIKSGTLVSVEYASKEASLEIKPAQAAQLDAADNRFQIPYDRGLVEITPMDWPEWTSEYPELVFASFSFQYARGELHDYLDGDVTTVVAQVRTQIRLFIDGVSLPGAGPAAIPFDGLSRGTGLGSASAFTTIHAMAIVPAGSHRVSARAGQKYAGRSDDRPSGGAGMGSTDRSRDRGVERSDYSYSHQNKDNPPKTVVIGNRACTVLRFPRGGNLGG